MIRTELREESSSRPGTMRLIAASGIDYLPHHGELHRERRSPAGCAVHVDLPGMFLNDAVGHREPQPGATTVAGLCRRLVLGGKEWIVDATDVFLGDTRAGVGNDDSHVVAVVGA